MTSRKRNLGHAIVSPPFWFLYGPDRVVISYGSSLERPIRYQPFHGIISRGLKNAVEEYGLKFDWEQYCHFLDAAQDGDVEAATYLPVPLLELARDCHVLSLNKSFAATRAFVINHLKDIRHSMPCDHSEINRIEFWNLKEGHTSSVWKITLYFDRDEGQWSFALNISRDDVAGEEMLSAATILEDISLRITSARIAHILFVTCLSAVRGSPKVVAVAQEWIEDAVELGFLVARETGYRTLYAIERFVTSTDKPGRISSIVVNRLDETMQHRIFLTILLATLEGAVVNSATRRIGFPRFELNEGDWVLSNGHACLVALSSDVEAFTPKKALDYALYHIQLQYQISNSQEQARLFQLAKDAVQLSMNRDLAVAKYWHSLVSAYGFE